VDLPKQDGGILGLGWYFAAEQAETVSADGVQLNA
jgi:hypothetical protein